MDGVGGGKVEVVQSKGCSKLVVGVSSPLSSIRSIQSLEPMSPTSSSLPSEPVTARSTAPFAGLVICVTGLSKGIQFRPSLGKKKTSAPSVFYTLQKYIENVI